MAVANKFWMMIHKNNTPKIGVILIYTVLEWILIGLLLLDGVFSYLIASFAEFFGLEPPCFLCSHALGGTQLTYCSRHLSRAGHTCDEEEEEKDDLFVTAMMMEDASVDAILLPRMMEAEERLVPVDLVDSSTKSDVFNASIPRGILSRNDDQEGSIPVECADSSTKSDVFDTSRNEDQDVVQVGVDDHSLSKSDVFNTSRHEDGVDDQERLIPMELVDSPLKSDVDDGRDSVMVVEDEEQPEEEEAEATVPVVESVEDSSENHLFRPIFFQNNCNDVHISHIVALQQQQEEEEEAYGEFQAATKEDGKMIDVEANCEISIGSEIDYQEEHIGLSDSNEPTLVPFTDDDNDMMEREQYVPELTVSVVESTDEALHRGLSFRPELINEEERAPETPNSVDSLHSLHKRFLFDRREFGTESPDGSVASEIDGSEILTVDHLKTALKSERKALSALYAELEEERSASAIAANQTMAMITRLQEEKAAMQMEALQYQRMMEEQSEYDQEALQLLNELMMKREKEKQELEKELEAYRKNAFVNEAKVRRMSRANGRSASSSGSLSADESNIDVSSESHDGGEHQNTPTHDVLSFAADQHLISLDDSLADFEEERSSILEQLKALEEKLLSLDDDDNLKGMGFGQHFSNANGHGTNWDDANVGAANGFVHDLDTNGRFHCKPRKSLLPLFDATVVMEGDDGLSNSSLDSFAKSATDYQKKLAIAEEVDNVYERLQALEADREFLKHCISSLKKGDKGMDLLQEILRNLRDLRNVQLRVRNAGYALASLSA